VNAIGVAVTKLVKEDAIFASDAFCNKIVDDANNVVVVLAPEAGTTVKTVVVVVLALLILKAVAEDTKLAVPFNVISTPTSLIISAIILPMPC
jgi:hypothetical protein